MGRRSTTGGVLPLGRNRIQFDFTLEGRRYRPSLPWTPTEANLRRAQERLRDIKARIAAGNFRFSEEFPNYRFLDRAPLPLGTLTCGEVFDAFLHHNEARVARNDLAPVTLASQRKILDRVWRPHIGHLPFLAIRYSKLIQIADSRRWNKKTYNNAISILRRAFSYGYQDYPGKGNPALGLRCARIGKKDRPPIDPFSIQDAETLIAALHEDWGEVQGNYDEFRFFTGLRPSEQIALVVTDYDAAHGVLSITKARVHGVDKDVTKTRTDRRVTLCPRAIAVLERQLQLRKYLLRAGRTRHNHLFVNDAGEVIRDLHEVYGRWHQTLKRLAIRYRKPYAARHSSVSWALMMGRNPLWVAKQHGHSISTMLAVYAAWTEGATESDVIAIEDALAAAPIIASVPEQNSRLVRNPPLLLEGLWGFVSRFASKKTPERGQLTENPTEVIGGEGGIRTHVYPCGHNWNSSPAPSTTRPPLRKSIGYETFLKA